MLQAAFKGVVAESSGFEYKAQRPQGATFVAQKWAWVGASPGAYAVLQVDTRLRRRGGGGGGAAEGAGLGAHQSGANAAAAAGGGGGGGSGGDSSSGNSGPKGAEAGGQADGAGGGGLARIYLGHTRSWQQLGTARVECVAGCSCEPATMDNHWQNKNTQNAMFALEVGGRVGLGEGRAVVVRRLLGRVGG